MPWLPEALWQPHHVLNRTSSTWHWKSLLLRPQLSLLQDCKDLRTAQEQWKKAQRKRKSEDVPTV